MNEIAEPPTETQALQRVDNSNLSPIGDTPKGKQIVYSGLIYSRIAACIGEIEAVGKDHKNQQQGYSFRAIDDFFDALQPVLAKHKVFISPTILSHTREERTTKSGGVLMTTLTHVRFRVWTEDGSFIEADALGEGSDSGDKSANKSASQALKYLFMQVFCVRVSGESNDTERESPAYNAKPPQNAPKQYTTSPQRTYQKPAPPANVERAAATPESVLPAQATPKTLEWAWNSLVSEFGESGVVWNFLVSKQWVDAASDDYTTWKLEHVPTSKQALAALADEIRKTVEAPSEPEKGKLLVDSDLPPEWASVIFTIPPKGSKRADWLATKTTIGMMYRSDNAEDKKRLFSFAKNWTPEPWVGNDGKKRPVSPEDAECRIALDMFMDWRSQRGETEESQ